MGNSMPTQDKLRVLAEWLQVSPDGLRFGNPLSVGQESAADSLRGSLNLADREMLNRYLTLSTTDRKIVRDVVEALCVAATVKKAK